MPDRIEVIKELNRRGILPADKRPLYDEAVRRGLIQDTTPAPQGDIFDQVHAEMYPQQANQSGTIQIRQVSQPSTEDDIRRNNNVVFDQVVADHQQQRQQPAQSSVSLQQARGFIQNLRSRFPQYNNVDDVTLADRLAANYPQYRDVAAAFKQPQGDIIDQVADQMVQSSRVEQQLPGVSRILDGSPDAWRLAHTGITPGTAVEFAGLHIQHEKAQGRELDANQQLAIQDIYKELAGRHDTSNQNFGTENKQIDLAHRGDTLFGRVRNAGSAFFGDTTTAAVQTAVSPFSPDAGRWLENRIGQVFEHDPNSLSSKAGSFGAIALQAGALGELGPVAQGVQMGLQGVGSTREDIANLREHGAQISGGAEAATALGVGGVQAIGGYFLGRVFQGLGKWLQGAPEVAQKGLIAGEPTIIKGIIKSILPTLGATLTDVAINDATVVATNAIKKGVDPHKAITDGLTDATVNAIVMSPFGAKAAQGKHAREQAGARIVETANLQPGTIYTGEAVAKARGIDINEVGKLVERGELRRVDQGYEVVQSPPAAIENPPQAPAQEQTRTRADIAAEATRTIGDVPVERPDVPQDKTKAQLLVWADANGYDTTGMNNKGRGKIVTMLAEQRLQSQAKRTMEIQRGENVRAMAEQRQLPTDGATWDAGQLRKFADANGYTIDQRRMTIDENRGLKRRDAMRKQIEEQYALPKGEGPTGGIPETTAPAVDTLTPKLPEPPVDNLKSMNFTEFKTWATDNGYDVKSVTGRVKLNQEIARQRAEEIANATARFESSPDKTAAENVKLKGFYTDEQIAAMKPEQRVNALDAIDPQAKTAKATKLPKSPADNLKTMSFEQHKQWAKANGYDVSRATNRFKLNAEITRQRANADAQKIIARPELPNEAKGWTLRDLKTWARDNGYNVDGINDRVPLERAIHTASVYDLLAAEKRLRRTDPLTGAQNQVAYEENATRLFTDADTRNEHTAIVETDFGGLKVMNTVYGHDGGNEMLKLAHEAMREELRVPPQKDRPGDSLGSAAYRTGGDEFPLILRNTKNPQQVKAAMDRVQKAFDAKIAKAFPDLPPEARPFVAWNAEIREPGDARSVAELRTAAEAGVEPAKTKIKNERGVPEGRTELLDYVARRKQERATLTPEERAKPVKVAEQVNQEIADTANAARESAAKATPIPGEPKSKLGVPRELEKILTPLASRVRDISPPTFGRLMEMELNTHRLGNRYKNVLHTFLSAIPKAVGKEGSAKYNEFKLAWLNRDIAELKNILPEDLHSHVDFTVDVLKKIHADQVQAGVTLGQIENYLPRRVIDVDGLKKSLGSDAGIFDDALAQKAKLKGVPLTVEERNQVASDVIAGYGPKKPGNVGPAHARERSVDIVTPEQLKFYDDPTRSLLGYIDAAAKATERAKFLGRGDDPAQLAESVGKIVAETASDLNADKQAELAGLLQTRLLADTLHMPTWARVTKKAIYATTITHLGSGISQLTDVATAAWRYGPGNAVKGLKDALHITAGEKRIVLND
jgi:diguanylate cyclase (GGDEF)-like protein